MDGDWPTIAVRFALYGVLSGLFGLSAFALYGLRPGERRGAVALAPWLAGLALAGILLSGAGLVLLVGAMAGTPPWPVDRTILATLLSETAVGAAWKARVTALAAALVAAPLAAGRPLFLGMVAAAGAVALATLAWAGHGAMDEGAVGWLHLLADILHLVAAGAWLGALLVLLLLVGRPAARIDEVHLMLTHRALHGFGTVGTIVVGTIVATGLVSAWLLVGFANLPSLGTTLYGQLLIAKLALFGAMLGLATLNRFRLTPAVERSIAGRDHAGALRRLRLSLAIETACGVSVLALVAWLGMLAPPASAA